MNFKSKSKPSFHNKILHHHKSNPHPTGGHRDPPLHIWHWCYKFYSVGVNPRVDPWLLNHIQFTKQYIHQNQTKTSISQNIAIRHKHCICIPRADTGIRPLRKICYNAKKSKKI